MSYVTKIENNCYKIVTFLFHYREHIDEKYGCTLAQLLNLY